MYLFLSLSSFFYVLTSPLSASFLCINMVNVFFSLTENEKTFPTTLMLLPITSRLMLSFLFPHFPVTPQPINLSLLPPTILLCYPGKNDQRPPPLSNLVSFCQSSPCLPIHDLIHQSLFGYSSEVSAIGNFFFSRISTPALSWCYFFSCMTSSVPIASAFSHAT